MCFMTFIGSWRDLPPPRVVHLKRELDREFHCAHPLFSDPVKPAYDAFMDLCFKRSTSGEATHGSSAAPIGAPPVVAAARRLGAQLG